MSLAELLAKKKQDLAASRRSRTVKPPDGSSRWRIAGSRRGPDLQFWHDFGQHFVKDGAGAIKAIYMCVDKTFGKPCDICDAVSIAAKSATDDATLKLVQDAKSAARVLLNAVQLDGKEPGKVEILELPPSVFEMIIGICEEWVGAGETVLGVNGKDLIIGRSGTGKNTKYTVQVAAKSMPVAPTLFDKLHDLDEYVAQESSEQRMRALNSVRSLTGLLPAPSSSGFAATPGAAIPEEEDPYAVATPPGRRPAATPTKPVEFEDVPDTVTMAAGAAAAPPWDGAAAPAAAPASAPAAAAPAAAETTGDSELDALLAGLQ